MKKAPALLLALSLCVCMPALAIYKCESGGKVTYGDAPCADGKTLDINTTPAAPADAALRAEQEKKRLTQLEKERHKREAVEAKERRSAAQASAARRKKCATMARRQKRSNEDVASSVGKAADRARLKARRITEDYEAECGRWPERELSVAR